MINNKDTMCCCIIDTMQLTTNINNFKDSSIIDFFDFAKHLKDEINKLGAFKVFKINPNKLNGYKQVANINECISNIDKIYDLLSVIDKEKIQLNRVDIAIDSNLDFIENFKFLLFLFEICTLGQTNKWFTTNLNTLKNNTIILKNRTVEVCFYNKKEESNNRHRFNTRMEWRFKRVTGNDYIKYLNNLIDKLSLIENNIEELEENMSLRLIQLWEKEKEEIQSFSEFVRKYELYFYTINILKNVYCKSNLNGSCENWIKKFRKNNNIKFYCKADIVSFKSKILKSIKDFKQM